jgi:hypothetical protein
VNPHVLPYMHPRSPIARFVEAFPWLSEFVMAELRHRVKLVCMSHRHAAFGLAHMLRTTLC